MKDASAMLWRIEKASYGRLSALSEIALRLAINDFSGRMIARASTILPSEVQRRRSTARIRQQSARVKDRYRRVTTALAQDGAFSGMLTQTSRTCSDRLSARRLSSFLSRALSSERIGNMTL